MKQKILIVALTLFSTFCFSQEINTIFSNDSSKTISFGGYGTPLIEATHINNNWGLAIGGKGGFIINRKFTFGGIGKGLVNSDSFIGDNLSGNQNAVLSLSYGAGGIFAEYIFKLESPIHISIPVNLLAGGASVRSDNSDTAIESTGIFIIEPGINLEFNISKYFIPAVNISYKQVSGSALINLNNQDLSGLNIGIIFKLGYF